MEAMLYGLDHFALLYSMNGLEKVSGLLVVDR